MGRRAFGPTKKKACDTRHCAKRKKGPEFKEKLGSGVKHPRAFEGQEQPF